MTVQADSQSQDYLGLSSDVKPTANIGAGIQFYELDTGATYIYNGSAWVLKLGGGGGSSAGALAASESHIGGVTGYATILDVTLSLDTSIYADGDVLAATQEVAGAVRVSGGISLLTAVQVIDEDDLGIAFDLIFFNANTTVAAENAAYAPTDADGRTMLGWARFVAGDFTDWGVFRTAWLKRGDAALKAELLKPATGTSIYIAAISRGAGTYTAAGIRVRLHVLMVN